MTDTGAGIKEADIARLFSAFVRVESSVRALREQGWDYILTKKLITEVLKGEMTVHECLWSGQHIYHKDSGENMKKVLVIEDNSDNLKLITYALRRSGYEVISAETGEAGIEMAIREKPFFIIMDIDLPGIDGLETTRRIRNSRPRDADHRHDVLCNGGRQGKNPGRQAATATLKSP